MERKWRNLLIAVATSIGFVGVLISFGLGNALISMIDENTNGGKLPSQVQIALNSSVAGRGFLVLRSEERRVGKECRSRWSPYH